MAVMTVANAITAIRASSFHDVDTQVTDAQITTRIDLEYKRLHRALSQIIPNLFESVSTPTITTTATPSFAKPANTEKVQKVERLRVGTDYFPLEMGDALNWRNPLTLSWYEQSANIQIAPAADSVGSYRLTVLLGVVTGYTSLDLLPDGCEVIVIERCAAWVRNRHKEYGAIKFHMDTANDVWREQSSFLMRRSGAHPKPGLVRVR